MPGTIPVARWLQTSRKGNVPQLPQCSPSFKGAEPSPAGQLEDKGQREKAATVQVTGTWPAEVSSSGIAMCPHRRSCHSGQCVDRKELKAMVEREAAVGTARETQLLVPSVFRGRGAKHIRWLTQRYF